jgi:hypothetical protein
MRKRTRRAVLVVALLALGLAAGGYGLVQATKSSAERAYRRLSLTMTEAEVLDAVGPPERSYPVVQGLARSVTLLDGQGRRLPDGEYTVHAWRFRDGSCLLVVCGPDGTTYQRGYDDPPSPGPLLERFWRLARAVVGL